MTFRLGAKYINWTQRDEHAQSESIIVAFVGFPRIFVVGILNFKGLTAIRHYKSFGVKWLSCVWRYILYIHFTLQMMTLLRQLTFSSSEYKQVELVISKLEQIAERGACGLL
jgi:hypothetical protein